MSDDEEENNQALFDDDKRIEFDPTDTTVSVPHPAHNIVVVPSETSKAPFQIIAIPHPRHRGDALFILGPRGELLELQEHRRRFGMTWFIGDTVEPSSGLFIATPIDHTFVALMVARTVAPGQDGCFVDASELLRRQVLIDGLPASTKARISACFPHVCDVRQAGGDNYFRYSELKFKQWVKEKHQALLSSTELAAALQTNDEGILKAAALELLSEYVDTSLKEVLCAACGVSLAVQQSIPSTASHWEQKDPHDEVKKKARVEVKSSPAVRRLEKGGPPKGTPTLMAMFAKKKQAPPS